MSTIARGHVLYISNVNLDFLDSGDAIMENGSECGVKGTIVILKPMFLLKNTTKSGSLCFFLKLFINLYTTMIKEVKTF